MTATVHQYKARYDAADKPEVTARVVEILKRDLDAIEVERANEADDRQGVDFWAFRACGRKQGVDVKDRRRDWGDVHVEFVSRVAEQKPGWTVDRKKITDYVLYLWPKRYLLLPYPLLQATVRRNELAYRADYPAADAKSTSDSGAWRTEGCAVPEGRLFRDMFGVGAPLGTPLTLPRTCPACNLEHPVGTTCADGWAPWDAF